MLQQTHKEKINVIYIDPPYSGGRGLVYNDSFVEPTDNWKHSRWLSFINRRLRLAKDLLSDDGVIFISIDDAEQANLKLLCDEVFGEGNFIANVIIDSNSAKNQTDFIGVTHEYLLCYAKNVAELKELGGWKTEKLYLKEFKEKIGYLLKIGLSDEEIHEELREFVKLPRMKAFDHYIYADKNGIYQAGDLTSPSSSDFYSITHPTTGKACKNSSRGWAFDKDEMDELIAEGRIHFGKDETTIPRLKHYIDVTGVQVPRSVVFFDSQSTTKKLKDLGLRFDYPKAVELITWALSLYPKKDALVLDFFAGSGVTAHAVMEVNAKDGGTRRWIVCTNNAIYPNNRYIT